MKMAPMDGGKVRILDLKRKGANGVEEVAVTNKKSRWLVKEFYPGRGAGATDPPNDTEYPTPLWKYQPISEAILHLVIAKLKPWKATRSGTYPNSIYKFCADLLVPRLCAIYCALDVFEHGPADWKVTETIVGCKPGKPDYSNPGVHRPLILPYFPMDTRGYRTQRRTTKYR
jgi:hypothetical protein